MFNENDDNSGVNLVVLYKTVHDKVCVTQKKVYGRKDIKCTIGLLTCREKKIELLLFTVGEI
jgi:hypothetical protein